MLVPLENAVRLLEEYCSKRVCYHLGLFKTCRMALGAKCFLELPSSDYPGHFCELVLVGPGTFPATDSI